MITACLSGAVLPGNADAIAEYESAVRAFLQHRPAMPYLLKALALDPELLAAHIMKGFYNVLLARRETMAQARIDLAGVRGTLVLNGVSPRDKSLTGALALSAAGYFDQSIAVLRDVVTREPHDLLSIKLVHSLQFMAGRSQEMAGFTASVLPAWRENAPGYGHVLGCHAFGLGETGQFHKAEAAATAALNYNGQDLWAMHALAHVYEMNGRNREGIIWVESARDLWRDAPNFSFHLAWHLALFNLNLGKCDRALAIYDRDIRAIKSEDFRDIANAVSLLWRLRQEGVDVGDRFDELADIAGRRSSDTTLVFACLHNLLSLIAVGQMDGAEKLVAEMADPCNGASGMQAEVAREIGLPLARTLLTLGNGGQFKEDFGGLASRLPLLGGSHAQRDVFLGALTLMAADAGDRAALDVLLGYRHSLRREDRFLHFVEGRARQSAARHVTSRFVA